MFRAICGLVLAWLATSGAARACSVGADYFIPLNYDLVRMADSIVLARRDGRSYREQSSALYALRFEVVQTIVGERGPYEVVVRDFWGDDDPERLARRSDHASLSAVHPDVHSGPCDRVSFPEDALFVFFLTYDGSWELLDFPMARTREDVPGMDSLWVWAIQHYAAIAALDSDADQYAALVALRDAPPSGPAAWQNELVRDISDYLESETPRKTPGFLTAQISDPNARPAEQAGALMSMASAGVAVDPARLAELSNASIPLPLVAGLAEAYLAQSQPEQAWSVLRGRLSDVASYGAYRDQGVMRTVIADQLADMPLDLLMEAYSAFPATAAGVTWDAEAMASRLAPLAEMDPAADPQLAMTLVRFGFTEPLDWAQDALANGSMTSEALAIRLIAQASAPEGEDMLGTLVCQAPEYHSALVRALAQSTNPAAADWIYAIWRHPDGDEWSRADARVVLGRMAINQVDAGRYFHPVTGWGEARWSFWRDRAWLLAEAIDSGETPPAQARLRTCAGD
jgi:hypothetical protein